MYILTSYGFSKIVTMGPTACIYFTWEESEYRVLMTQNYNSDYAETGVTNWRNSDPTIILGSYDDYKRCGEVILEIAESISNGEKLYKMP